MSLAIDQIDIDTLIQEAERNFPIIKKMFALNLVPDIPLEELYEIVCALNKSNNFAKAAPLAFQLAMLHPQKSEYTFLAAQIFQHLSIYNVAGAFYLFCLENHPTPAVHFGLAQCLSNLHQYELALRHFELALDLARGEFKWRTLLEHAEKAIELLAKKL